jgi:MFS family permease
MPRDYYKLIAARFFYVLAVQMQSVVLGWQMYVLSENAFYLGLIGLAEAVPALGFALYAGYYVDHRKPLPVLFKIYLCSAISAALMFFGQGSGTGLSVRSRIAALFLSSFLTGIARAFAHPTIYTLTPGIVPRELLAKAAAMSASTMQVARISGPALGGLLFGFLGISRTAGVVCALIMLAVLCATRIETDPEAPQRLASSESFREKLLAGAKYVGRHPILFPAMTLDMVSMFLGGVTALLPIFVSQILHADSEELGLLRSAPSIGAALMGVVLVRVPLKQRAGPAMYSAIIGFGAAICVFSLSTSLAISTLALVASGAFDSISVVIRTSAIQLCSPDAIRGRISSVNSIFVSSSNELGEFESGILAGMFGAVPAALFGGVACIATALVMLFRFPALRRLDLEKLPE